MRYDRYEKEGGVHWDWFEDPTQQWYRVLVNNSLKYLVEERGLVLDVGCGDGRVDKILIELGFGVVGIEPEIAGCNIARERVPEMTIINANVENTDIPSADFLYSLNTIEHVKKPEIYLDIMKKIRRFGMVITDNGELHRGGKYHEREYTVQELENLFSGLKTERLDLGMVDFIGLKIWQN